MRTETLTALADRLAAYDRIVEIGIGRRTALAHELATRGLAVTATDIVHRETPDGVRFVRDNVTDPTDQVYADADALFAQNLPPELHEPTAQVARDADAVVLFTTLGGDPPLLPVRRETLPGETLYVWTPTE